MQNDIISGYSMDLLLDNIAAGLYFRHISKTGEREYIYFNRAIKEVFESEDVTNSPLWKQDRDDEHDSIVLNTIEPYYEEYPIPDDDGNVRKWLVFLKRKVKSNHFIDDEYFIVTTVIDITERKKRELELFQSRLNLKIATDAGRMSTWNLDVEKRVFTITNGLDVKSPTISLEEHIMLRHYNPKDKNSKNIHTDMFDVMSGKKETGHGMYMIKDAKSGEILYRQSSFMGIKVNGVVTHVIGSTQDATESYKQKERLEKNRDELNLALAAGHISAWTYDVKEKMFHTLFGNPIAGKGISYDNLLAKMHPDDVPLLLSSLDSIISQKEKEAAGVFRFHTNDSPAGYKYYDSRMIGSMEEGEIISITGTQKDITEEYLHQSQVEDFNLKAKLINKATNSIMWDYDIDKHALLVYTDNALVPEQIITLGNYTQYIHPKDHAAALEYFSKADNRELDEFSFDIAYKMPWAKEYKKISANGVAVKDENGNILKYTGIWHDVTKLTELNNELKEQNNLNNLVVNNLLAGLLLITDDCKIVWSNESAKSSFGKILNMKNFDAGENCDFLINGKCTKKDGCFLKKAIAENKVCTIEREYAKGTFLEVSAIPVNNTEGLSQGAILKLRDISESKRMLLEMKQSKENAEAATEFISTLMDRMPCAVFIVDPQNEFRHIKVNNKFCSSIQRQSEDIIGKNNFEIFGKEMAAKYNQYDLLLANESEGEISYEATMKIDNKEVYWVINKSIITFEGRKLILSVSTDITPLKNLNNELSEAKEKALQADKLKSAFLANMSHEIRTPLNAIVGFSQLLTETEDQQEKIQYSKIINNNTQMLLRLIGDILDLSKIESGTTEFRRDLVDVSSFFNELTASLSFKVTNPDVNFIIDNPYKVCYINLDKLRFGQVVTNFVTNAIKYTQKGHIKVSYYIERHGVMIRVEDTGIGIPAEKRDRVFTRFDKLDSMVQGSGLGLPIAKVLTEIGGGKIWFESEEGKGSTFYSWKPFSDIRIVKAQNATPDKITNDVKEDSNEEMTPHVIKKVLIAEDNESNFLVMQKMLGNYQTEWAKNGVEAVEKVAKSNYDLVLMDIKMPIMDGIDATKQIRKFNSAIPIVAVTANAYAIDEDAALHAGCNEFLSKPILKEDLLNVMKKV